MLGDEEKVSKDYQCENFNEKCVATQTYSHTTSTTHTIGVDLAGVLSTFNALLDKLTMKYSASFGSSASVSGSMACHSGPGWKSWITFRPKYLRVEGTLTKKCHHRQNGWIPEKNTYDSGHSISKTPMKTSDGEEDGVLTCRTGPIADMSGGNVIYNLQKFQNGAEKDVVQKAVEEVIKSVMSRTTVQKKFSDNGIEIWSEGQCFNGIFNSVCKGCLQKLYATLFKDCNSGRGCQSAVRDCKIRYQFYAFEETL